MTNDKFSKNFINIYTEKIGLKNAEKIIDNFQDLIKTEMLDSNNFAQNKTGILVGKIQSGKTGNFLGLISTIFDHNYDVAIVFSGKDKTLRQQTKERIEEVFDNDNLSCDNTIAFSQPVKIITSDSEALNNASASKILSKSTKLIIVALKNTSHFTALENFLKHNSIYLQQKNILIIDDEGDQGTLNGKVRKDEMTRWYEQMVLVRTNCPHYTFLTVTATPYANFFIDLKDTLLPQFIKPIYPGENYHGLSFFHAEDSSSIIEIDDEEVDFYKAREPKISEWGLNTNKSLNKAISAFIVGSIERKKQNKNAPNKSEMILHIDHKKQVHESLKHLVDDILNHYHSASLKKIESLQFKEFIQEFVNPGFRVYFQRDIDLDNQDDQLFLSAIKDSLDAIETVIYNADHARSDLIRRNSSPLIIYIGAALIERGMTFKNLIIVYMPRMAKGKTNIDTLLQRARWFGYRDEYVSLIRIFLPYLEIGQFETIRYEEEILWNDLQRLEDGEFESPTKWIETLAIRIGDSKYRLRATRANVMAKDVIEQSSLRSWFAQSKYNDLLKTKTIEEQWYETNSHRAMPEYFGGTQHNVLNFKSLKEFEIEFEQIKSIFLRHCNIDARLYSEYSHEHEDKEVNLIFMYPNMMNSFRTIGLNNSLSLFAHGADNTKEYNQMINDTQYLGDRNIDYYPINKDKIVILVYYFKSIKLDKLGIDEVSNQIAYAIHFPSGSSRYAYRSIREFVEREV